MSSQRGRTPSGRGPATEFTDAWDTTGSLQALRELVVATQRLRHVIARRAGLSETDLLAMEHLLEEPMGPAELARRLNVSTAAATGIVDRLADRGHVERHPDADDRRRTTVAVTDSGREDVLGALLPMFVGLDRLHHSFSEKERVVIEKYLRGVREVFDHLDAESPGR